MAIRMRLGRDERVPAGLGLRAWPASSSDLSRACPAPAATGRHQAGRSGLDAEPAGQAVPPETATPERRQVRCSSPISVAWGFQSAPAVVARGRRTGRRPDPATHRRGSTSAGVTPPLEQPGVVVEIDGGLPAGVGLVSDLVAQEGRTPAPSSPRRTVHPARERGRGRPGWPRSGPRTRRGIPPRSPRSAPRDRGRRRTPRATR